MLVATGLLRQGFNMALLARQSWYGTLHEWAFRNLGKRILLFTQRASCHVRTYLQMAEIDSKIFGRGCGIFTHPGHWLF